MFGIQEENYTKIKMYKSLYVRKTQLKNHQSFLFQTCFHMSF